MRPKGEAFWPRLSPEAIESFFASVAVGPDAIESFSFCAWNDNASRRC